MQNVSNLHVESIFEHLPDNACLTLEVLEEATSLSRHQLFRVMGRMVTDGLIQRRKVGCYQFTRAGLKAKRSGVIPAPAAPPKTGKAPDDSFRQRLWSVMRMSAVFMVPELVMVADWPSEHPHREATKYLRDLKRAGYVVELPARKGSPRRFRLIRNTGQIAPVRVASERLIRDPNTGEVLPCAIAS